MRLFLPALLFVKIGSELHSASAWHYLIILIWAFIVHLIYFLIEVFAHLLFKMPDWITAAIKFNNTASFPLLLMQSLGDTGILNFLISRGENIYDAIERAKSYFLVFATLSPASHLLLAQGWLIASIYLTYQMTATAIKITRCTMTEEKLFNTIMSRGPGSSS